MRKNKKSIGSHALGNRTVIGIICIVAALAICFGIAPVVNKLRDGKTAVVRVVRTVEKGSPITDADIEIAEVGSYGDLLIPAKRLSQPNLRQPFTITIRQRSSCCIPTLKRRRSP